MERMRARVAELERERDALVSAIGMSHAVLTTALRRVPVGRQQIGSIGDIEVDVGRDRFFDGHDGDGIGGQEAKP